MSKKLNDEYLGIITYNQDPTFSGRCKVRVFNLMDTIEDEFLPWAVPCNALVFGTQGAGSLSIPKVGTLVGVKFKNDDKMSPEYYNIHHVDPSLIEQIKTDYEGTHVLVYDTSQNLTVIFQKGTGFTIYFNGSVINISPTSEIFISHANSSSSVILRDGIIDINSNATINVGSDDTGTVNIEGGNVNIDGRDGINMTGNFKNENAVNGQNLYNLLLTMANAIDAKMPQSPGTTSGIVRSSKSAIINSNIRYR